MAKLFKGAAGILEAITGLKKAIIKPIGRPEQVREEAPIGWDFGPDGAPIRHELDRGSDRFERPDDGALPSIPGEHGGRGSAQGIGRAGNGGDGAGSVSADEAGFALSPAGERLPDGGSPRGISPAFENPRTAPMAPSDPTSGATPSSPAGSGGADSGGDSAGDGDREESETGETGGTDLGPPMIGGVGSGGVTEDDVLTASGLLVGLSPGGGVTWSMVGDGAGEYGKIDFDVSTGQWTYRLDNEAAQHLKAGDTAQEIFTVKVTDAAGGEAVQKIAITVTGTNDTPAISSGAVVGMVKEDGALTASGSLIAADADAGDTATWSVVGSTVGNYGTLTLDDNGAWTYALDNAAAQGLRADETAREIFTIKVTDASGASVTTMVRIVVSGTNDTPVISGTATGTVEEDTVLTATGTLTAADTDIGDTATWSILGSAGGAYGALTLNDDGSWSYALDGEAAQGLKAGETAQDIFTVQVTDSAGGSVTQTVTVTVSGTNDTPVISGTITGSVQEDLALTTSGTLTAADADIGDTATWSILGSADGAYGALTLNDDGRWSYALDNDAAQSLKAGDTAQDIFTVQVTDASGASVTQTVTVIVGGTNDAPAITGTAVGTVREDTTFSASGTLDVSDADIGDAAVWSVVGGGEAPMAALLSTRAVHGRMRWTTPRRRV